MGWRGVVCAAAVLLSSSAQAQARAPSEAELTTLAIEIEARARAIERSIAHGATADGLLQRARQHIGTDPHVSAALLQLMLQRGSGRTLRTEAMLELARAALALGDEVAAAKHFHDVLRISRRAHQVTAAFEGLVMVAERTRLAELPDWHSYLAAANHDHAAYETLYRLAREMARVGDDRAEPILVLMPDGGGLGRRAAYLRGVLALQRGALGEARTAFRMAAEFLPLLTGDPLENRRDAEVRELAWLAVGRLSFELGAYAEGVYAYHQVSVDSPRFEESFLELGWLAMEHDQRQAAVAAFEALSELAARAPNGRRAQLLHGYVLLEGSRYMEAVRHYEGLRVAFEEARRELARELAQVERLPELARSSEARARAAQSPWLAPILARPELASAEVLEGQLEDLLRRETAVRIQLESVAAMLSGEGRDNPLLQLVRDRREAVSLLRAVEQAMLDASRAASAAALPCCTDAAFRLRTERARLVRLVDELDARESELRDGLLALEDELDEALEEQRRIFDDLLPQVRAEQERLVRAAADAVLQDIDEMILEGEAGVLEAFWRHKKDKGEQVYALEQHRKQELEELDRSMAESLVELEDGRGGAFFARPATPR